jgi:hypothetical protein
MTFLAPASPLVGKAKTMNERVANQNDLVYYISPFGSSAWMPGWRAEASLEKDDRRWLRLLELEMVSDTQGAVGAPRIEQAPDK